MKKWNHNKDRDGNYLFLKTTDLKGDERLWPYARARREPMFRLLFVFTATLLFLACVTG